MNKYITSFLLLLFILPNSGCFFNSSKQPDADSSDFSAIERSGKLIFVTNYSSHDYYVNNDTLEGFNYGLIQLMKNYTNLEIDIQLESGLQKSIDSLNEKKYHVIAREIPVTTELKEKLLFTIPITQDRQVLVQRKPEYNNNLPLISSHLDLANKTLHVAKDSPAILRINNLSKEIASEIHYVEDEVYSGEQLAMMVAKGEIDYAVCGEKIAKKIIQDQPELDIGTLIGFTQLEAWAVSKDSPVLLDSLNHWLEAIKKTKEYKLLYRKYYR